MITRGKLLELGGVELLPSWGIKLDGNDYYPKESENGNGWYAGDCDDNDNLIYEIEKD